MHYIGAGVFKLKPQTIFFSDTRQLVVNNSPQIIDHKPIDRNYNLPHG